MRSAAIWIGVAACARPATAPIAHRAADEVEAKPERTQRFVERTLRVSRADPDATRGTAELVIDGSRATEVVTLEETTGTPTIERADHEAKWTKTESKTTRYLVRHVGETVAFDLEDSPGTPAMNCWHRTLVVASAGARLVPKPGHAKDCDDPGTWSPGTTMSRVDALVCGFGAEIDDGQKTGLDGPLGNLDETLTRFVAAPCVEFVYQDDDCFHSTGIRLIR